MKAAVVSAATAVLIAPTASAFAASATVKDGKDDTYVVTYGKKTTYEKSDVSKNVDITKVVVSFGKTLTVKTTYASLSKKGVDFGPFAELETDKGDSIGMQAGAYKDGSKWKYWGYLMTGPQSGRQASAARAADCGSLKPDINWKTGVVTMSTPSSCLGKVKWVKAHTFASGQETDADGNVVLYTDDSASAKGESDNWTGKIKKG